MQSTFRKALFAAVLLSVSLCAQAGDIRINFESPNNNFYTGIGTLRGWAISSVGINRVELYIDSQFVSLLPQGGIRLDVGNAFPSFPNSQNSGFAIAFNYASLATGITVGGSFFSTIGLHLATVRVVDNDGTVVEVSNPFANSRFLTDAYIPDSSRVNFDSVSDFGVEGSSYAIRGMLVDGVSYDVLHEWVSESQQAQPTMILLTSESQNAITIQQKSSTAQPVKQSNNLLEFLRTVKKALLASNSPSP